MRAVSAWIALSLLLGGCVSVPKKAISESDAAGWRGKKVVLTERPRASLVAMTAGKAAFALVGAAAAIEAGNKIVQQNGIDDPARRVGGQLLDIGVQRFGLVAADIPPVKTDTDDPARLAAAAKGADLLIDVQSLGEMFNYFPTDWSHYWVHSGLVLRVIDTHGGSVLGGGSCSRDTKKDGNPPTKDELLADNAALLKKILSAQWDSCRDELAEKLSAKT